MKNTKAYIRYDARGIIIPSTLIVRSMVLKDPDWVQIPESICCSTIDMPVLSNTKMRAWVRYDGDGNIIPSSTIIREKKPAKTSGTWVEVPYKKCCTFTPPAPTAGVVDDTANTFAYTLASGYTLAEHEITVDGGTTWTTATNPIVVGAVSKAINTVGVRVKGTANQNPSAILYNQTAFNA